VHCARFANFLTKEIDQGRIDVLFSFLFSIKAIEIFIVRMLPAAFPPFSPPFSPLPARIKARIPFLREI